MGSTPADSTKKSRGKLLLLPIVYYEPETSWAFGVGGVCYYHFDKRMNREKCRPSSFYFFASRTLERQTLFSLPFTIFTSGEHHYLFGEINYFHFPINYFGYGNDIDFDHHNLLNQQFLRARINITQKAGNSIYLGGQLALDHYYELELENMPLETPYWGNEGGSANGIGLNIISDERSHIYAPKRGHYFQSSVVFYPGPLNSGHTFTKWQLDLRGYQRIGKNSTLAMQLFGGFSTGDLPFFLLEQMGGMYRQRGLYKGSLRSKNQIMLQMEWRHWPLKRWGYVLFTGAGQVFNSPREIRSENLCLSGGLGIRFMLNRQERIPFRMDLAKSLFQSGYYATTGQAF